MTAAVAAATRVALVTGAAGGLGPACCRRLAQAGSRVVAADISAERLAEAADTIGAADGPVEGIPLDVTTPEEVDRLVTTIVERHGRLDALVNMAGVVATRSSRKSPTRTSL